MLISHLIAIALFATGTATAGDPCESALPADLRAAAARELPGAALPRQGDDDPEDVVYNLDHGGTGCIGVAKGSFTGLGRTDYALLLADKGSVWLVVASAHASSWRLEKVRELAPPANRVGLYVDVAPAGTYEECCLDGEPEKGQVLKFSSNHEVVVAGRVESSAIAFFKTKRGWVHLWLSD